MIESVAMNNPGSCGETPSGKIICMLIIHSQVPHFLFQDLGTHTNSKYH